MKAIRTLALLVLALGIHTAADAQVVLEKAVISNGGGRATNGATVLDVTVGQPVIGVASNGTITGSFGFWSSQGVAASVQGENGAGVVTSLRVSPNPVTTRGEAEIVLAKGGRVEVSLYDATGRSLGVLHDAQQPAGRLTVRFDLSALPSGSYYLAVSAPGALVQERVMVVR